LGSEERGVEREKREREMEEGDSTKVQVGIK
jgi:hypothetical protein